MSINFEYYKVFYNVAKYQKISLAAEKLYVSQPAVTQTIQKLEEQLGCNLLVRTKNGIELTEPGKTLYEIISNSIETLENCEYKIGKYELLQEGTIKIRAGSNTAKLGLFDALEKFGKDYPNIKVEISTGAPNQSAEMLNTGEIDMMLVYLPYKIPYDNMNIIEYTHQEYVFAMSKKYFEDNKVSIKKIEDLNNYSLIVPKAESAIGNMFKENFKDKITDYHYEIVQEQLKKEMVMRNMGIAFMLRKGIEEEINLGEIIEVELKSARITGGIGIVTLNSKYATFATKKLLEYLK